MLAALVKTPELALRQDEAKTLGEGIAQVAQFYDVQASEKTIAWTNLSIAVAVVYGPRLVALMGNRPSKAEKPEVEKPVPAGRKNANLVTIPGLGPVDVGTGMPQ